MNENFLEHYGIKGMKWGIRKRSSSSNRSEGDSVAKKAAKLSDVELRARVNRLNMEKQYEKLVSEKNQKPPTAIDRGAKYVGKIVKNNADYAVRRGTKNVVKMVVDNYSKDLAKTAGQRIQDRIVKIN